MEEVICFKWMLCKAVLDACTLHSRGLISKVDWWFSHSQSVAN